MTFFARFRFSLRALALVTPLLLAAAPAAAQSIVVEGLQIMLDAVGNDDQRREVIRLGEEFHQELSDEADDLQEMRENADGFLLYDETGRPLSVTEAEAMDLAETLATDMALADDPYSVAMGLLLRGEDGGELERAVAHSIFGAMEMQSRGMKGSGFTSSAEELITNLSQSLLLLLEEADQRNRQALEERLEQIFADRSAVSNIVAQAEASWGPIVPPAPDAPEGFMNEAGYYVAQVSGTGWRKGGAGYATEITGYENFIFEVTSEVSEATRTRYLWQVPPGYDIQVFEREQQDEARDRSRTNCESLPGLGPRDPAPDIWSDGPHYELVQGPIAEWSEALALRGNARLNNNDPAGSSFWHHDGDHRWDDLDPICERYGVSLVD